MVVYLIYQVSPIVSTSPATGERKENSLSAKQVAIESKKGVSKNKKLLANGKLDLNRTDIFDIDISSSYNPEFEFCYKKQQLVTEKNIHESFINV